MLPLDAKVLVGLSVSRCVKVLFALLRCESDGGAGKREHTCQLWNYVVGDILMLHVEFTFVVLARAGEDLVDLASSLQFPPVLLLIVALTQYH